MQQIAVPDKADKQPDAPAFYALLPVLPIVLLFIFSKFCITTVRLELETAILTCVIFTFLIDCMHRRSFTQAVEQTKEIFRGMGRVFTSTVSLIICAGVFAEGLKRSGGIDSIIAFAATFETAGGIAMLFVMCLILMLAAILTGSANAAFFAFASLIPGAAKAVGWSVITMICPVQLVSGIARSMSPISGDKTAPKMK